jgi:hypothetical protein
LPGKNSRKQTKKFKKLKSLSFLSDTQEKQEGKGLLQETGISMERNPKEKYTRSRKNENVEKRKFP